MFYDLESSLQRAKPCFVFRNRKIFLFSFFLKIFEAAENISIDSKDPNNCSRRRQQQQQQQQQQQLAAQIVKLGIVKK